MFDTPRLPQFIRVHRAKMFKSLGKVDVFFSEEFFVGRFAFIDWSCKVSLVVPVLRVTYPGCDSGGDLRAVATTRLSSKVSQT